MFDSGCSRCVGNYVCDRIRLGPLGARGRDAADRTPTERRRVFEAGSGVSYRCRSWRRRSPWRRAGGRRAGSAGGCGPQSRSGCARRPPPAAPRRRSSAKC
eukprot:1187619-Prorocentrum_minimum.AAC.2